MTPADVCDPVAMRTAVILLCVLAVVAAVIVGVRQARDGAGTQHAPAPLTRAEVSRPIPGAPPELAALRRRVNELRGGGVAAFDAQLRALRGHPVVVNMWASWCPPCRIELPSFQREAVRRGASVAFLGVNVGDARGDALKLARRYPMPYPSFTDPRSNIVAGRFGAHALPVTAFFDARGKLAIVRQGEFASEAKLAESIERYALR
ncbi:MAG: cytochrome c biosis protein CcmG, thiol:disulfide interchange protein DsbE [Solirubrobacteraceae bacterium]|jgi:thiol-disulfide isomerase/thioredoxin|nr:cytochrome c biosis protein CcmG, thiol:disulfide interchange protein DsbE [Solirubrobacteraceae bacterium]